MASKVISSDAKIGCSQDEIVIIQNNGSIKNDKRREPNRVMVYLAYVGVLYNVTFVGFVLYGMNIIFVELIDVFDVSRAEASIVPTAFLLVPTFTRFIVAQVVRKVGPGIAISIGGCVAAGGCIAASFATSYAVVIVFVGVITALGSSTVMQTCYQTPVHLTSGRRRHLLTSVISVCSGLGHTLGGLLLKYMMDAFMFQGSMLIIGGLYLQCLAFGVCVWSVLRSSDKNSEVENGKGCFKDVLLLLRNSTFLMALIADLVCLSLVFAYITFLVDHVEDAGFSRQTGALFASIFGFTALIGRLVNGLIHQVKLWHGIYHYSCILLGYGTCLTVVPLLSTYTGLMSANCVLGFLAGPMFQYMFLLSYEIVDDNHYPYAMAFHLVVFGIANSLSVPLGGWIRDMTGKYDLVFYLGLPVCGTSALVLTATHAIRTFLKKDSVNFN